MDSCQYLLLKRLLGEQNYNFCVTRLVFQTILCIFCIRLDDPLGFAHLFSVLVNQLAPSLISCRSRSCSSPPR